MKLFKVAKNKNLVFSILLFFSIKVFSNATTNSKRVCSENQNNLASFAEIISHVRPLKEKTLDVKEVKNLTETADNEILILIQHKPFEAKYIILPNSKVEVIEKSTNDCGMKFNLIYGKIESDGDHTFFEKCGYEIATEEAELTPVGTRYSAHVTRRSIAEELDKLNFLEDAEDSQSNDEVRVGETYTAEKGEVMIRLKRIKPSAKLKITKFKKQGNKKSTTIAGSKLKPFKIKAGQKIKFVKNKFIKPKRGNKKIAEQKTLKSKKMRTAELEIYEIREN